MDFQNSSRPESAFQFPRLAKHYGFGHMIDLDLGKWRGFLHSKYAESHESKINKVLYAIHEKNGKNAYLWNRVREYVSAEILEQLLGYTISPSTMVNDILYGVDAVAILPRGPVAIDFTTNPQAINEKVEKDPNGVVLLDPRENETHLTKAVVWINKSSLYPFMYDVERELGGDTNLSTQNITQKYVEKMVFESLSNKGSLESEIQVHTKNTILSRDIQEFFRSQVEKILDTPKKSQSIE